MSRVRDCGQSMIWEQVAQASQVQVTAIPEPIMMRALAFVQMPMDKN